MIPMVKRMPPLPGSGSVFPSRASSATGKHREDGAAEFECRELFVIDELRPAELAVELPKRRENHGRRG